MSENSYLFRKTPHIFYSHINSDKFFTKIFHYLKIGDTVAILSLSGKILVFNDWLKIKEKFKTKGDFISK